MDWLQQDNETDWDFIWRLARGIGYWLLIDGKKRGSSRPRTS